MYRATLRALFASTSRSMRLVIFGSWSMEIISASCLVAVSQP